MAELQKQQLYTAHDFMQCMTSYELIGRLVVKHDNYVTRLANRWYYLYDVWKCIMALG